MKIIVDGYSVLSSGQAQQILIKTKVYRRQNKKTEP